MHYTTTKELNNTQVSYDVFWALTKVSPNGKDNIDVHLARNGGDLELQLNASSFGLAGHFSNADTYAIVRALRNDGFTICGVELYDKNGKGHATAGRIVCERVGMFDDVESEVA